MKPFGDDCLWNGYVPRGSTPHLEFSSDDEAWQVREVVGRARKDSLSREFAAYSAELHKALPYKQLGLIDVKALLRDGRKQKLQLSTIDLESKEASWLLTMRAYASEPGLSEFLCSRLRVGSIHSDGPAPHITRQVV